MLQIKGLVCISRKILKTFFISTFSNGSLTVQVESAEHSSGLDAALEPAFVDDECEHNAVADLSDDEVLEHSSFDEVFEPVSADGAFNQAYKRFSVDKAYTPVCMKRVLKPASITISTQSKTTEECKYIFHMHELLKRFNRNYVCSS